jgi:hypothetical protein
MEKEKEAADAQEVLFKRLYRVKPDTFKKMLSILQREYDAMHQKGGKPPKLTVEEKLSICTAYAEIPTGVPDDGQYRGRIRDLQGHGVPVYPIDGRHPG